MGEARARCQTRSRSLHEPLHGTASTVRGWVLLEEPGPWGVDALRDSRLDADVSTRLHEICRRLRLRVVLIRRVRRQGQGSGQRHCFLARTGLGEGWVEQAVLDGPADVFDLDLEGLARGDRPGLQPVPDPLYFVCTHGRHDPCCAEQGRPVAEALSKHFPEQTWEVSHIGGDRFAGNLLALPHGFYFGRVPSDDAVPLAEAYARGELDTRYLRGRTAYGFATQAAECLLRQETEICGVDELPLISSRREGDEVEATFTAPDGGHYRVRLRSVPSHPERRLTCHADQPSVPSEHRLVELHHERG
ncbi:hypothetical protein DFQ14_102246 [Halopolyspora algeriensis]|uniref:Sucrase/ferredoxin-like protein n=1 Tax=Halopolyspora algeriensis TaxID=1500506 RepID=A0A368VV23_9ACTN|nr:sucrase ferredoxin [Halopolyspora algeriensis]RCW45944.1 hypothetical protein DFQ14_102246 [Halopolyspora algeriensis]TQM55357.1 hypothetical protein FHU43_0120 [Halopolyspora algeriensis]